MTEQKQALAYKSFGDVVTDGFKLFFKNYKYVVIPFAIFYTAFILIESLLLPDLVWYSILSTEKANKLAGQINSNPESISQSQMNTVIQSLMLSYLILFLTVIIETVFTVLATVSVSNFLYEKYTMGNSNFYDNFKNAFRGGKNLIYVVLIIGVFVGAGFFIFIIPGLLILGYFIFLVFVYNSKDVPHPITEARLIAKGSFWKIIGVFLISFLTTYIIDGVYTTLLSLFLPIDTTPFYNPATRNYGMILAVNLLYSILTILLAPLFICILTPLFSSLKSQKELGIIRKPVRYAPVQPYYQPYPPYSSPPQSNAPVPPIYPSSMPSTQYPLQNVPPSGGLFCPFCGFRIPSPKKFCPNCGQSIDFETT